jgi:hypothetical protein
MAMEPEELRGDDLEDATLDRDGGVGVEASLVVLGALVGALVLARRARRGSERA